MIDGEIVRAVVTAPLRLEVMRHRFEDGTTLDWKATGTHRLVALPLGMEPKDGSGPLDIDVAMKLLGWVRVKG